MTRIALLCYQNIREKQGPCGSVGTEENKSHDIVISSVIIQHHNRQPSQRVIIPSGPALLSQDDTQDLLWVPVRPHGIGQLLRRRGNHAIALAPIKKEDAL